MDIIKLNAIDSTNSYIKKMANEKPVKSYTVVMAEHQILGRGQVGTTWVSEKGKNLTFSLLIKFLKFKIQDQFYLSMAVSLGVLKTLNELVKIPLKVKWPNDILAGKDKVAGILIENILRGAFIKQSIIGIGLNVNQQYFPNSIGNATSLINIVGKEIDREDLLRKIINSIKFYVDFVERAEFEKLKELYISSLYKYHTPMMFEDKQGVIFLGKITDIDKSGQLIVTLDNDTIRKFSLKEIKFANH